MDGLNIQPYNACRCCLGTNGVWDLNVSYISENGVKEVYSDMILQCYGILLSLEEPLSHLICTPCVDQLRVANAFKNQILQAQKNLGTYYHNVKVEPGDTINSENYTETVNKHTDVAQCTDIAYKTDNVADTEEQCSELHNGTDEKCSDERKAIKNSSLSTKKKVSIQKQIRQTCDVLLKDTTACPFRHRKSWFQCFFCPHLFMKLSSLRSHTQQNHTDVDAELKKLKRYPRSLQVDITNFECRHCDLTLTDIEAMRLHFVDAHEKVVYREFIADFKIDGSPYTCHMCSKEFHVFRTLTTHLNEHYANCVCEVCGKAYLNSKRLKDHSRTHETGQYPCTECGKVLNTKISKSNHMETVHSNRVLKCQICFKPTKHYNDRIKHMSEEHNITHTFKCPICSKEFNIKHYLATHIRQIHGTKNKKCSECSMVFNTNHSLKKHLLRHTGVRSFKCDICSKSYGRNYTLKKHIDSAHAEVK